MAVENTVRKGEIACKGEIAWQDTSEQSPSTVRVKDRKDMNNASCRCYNISLKYS